MAVIGALAAWAAVRMAAREPAEATVQAAPVSYKVIEVVDGETLTIVDAGGIRTRVGLRDVDAPELDEPGGPEAKAALEEKLLGRQVKVTPYARDRSGRLVAEVEP